jgi:hypothetical protein
MSHVISARVIFQLRVNVNQSPFTPRANLSLTIHTQAGYRNTSNWGETLNRGTTGKVIVGEVFALGYSNLSRLLRVWLGKKFVQTETSAT